MRQITSNEATQLYKDTFVEYPSRIIPLTPTNNFDYILSFKVKGEEYFIKTVCDKPLSGGIAYIPADIVSAALLSNGVGANLTPIVVRDDRWMITYTLPINGRQATFYLSNSLVHKMY